MRPYTVRSRKDGGDWQTHSHNWTQRSGANGLAQQLIQSGQADEVTVECPERGATDRWTRRETPAHRYDHERYFTGDE